MKPEDLMTIRTTTKLDEQIARWRLAKFLADEVLKILDLDGNWLPEDEEYQSFEDEMFKLLYKWETKDE
tara:strand:- start:8149 stop:8355 length:207 start_codon:yes stop_codon:yes gene_type:complete